MGQILFHSIVYIKQCLCLDVSVYPVLCTWCIFPCSIFCCSLWGHLEDIKNWPLMLYAHKWAKITFPVFFLVSSLCCTLSCNLAWHRSLQYPIQFSFSGCKFKVQRNKEGTGRVVMWKMGIQNSYTLEATFCGSTLGKNT